MILVFGTLSIFGSCDTVNKYSGTTRTNHQEGRILYHYIVFLTGGIFLNKFSNKLVGIG